MAIHDTLFTKAIDQISIDDVRRFFDQKIREGLRVDYKSNFPPDLAKYIIALANFSGGIILIGIRANKTTNEPEEIVGIDLSQGLEERVINISESNVKPRIIPEVKVCPFKSDNGLPKEDKAVLLIRVPESDLQPHIHTRNNEIWVRLHNRCAKADLETIERFFKKRNEAAALMKSSLDWVGTTIESIRNEFRTEERDYLQAFTIAPLFPSKIIQFNKTVDDYLTGQINKIITFNNRIPNPNRIEFKNLRSDNKISRYSMVTDRGLLLYLEPIDTNGGTYIETTIQSLNNILRTVIEIYSHFQIYSDLWVKVEYTDAPNKPLDLFNGHLEKIYYPLNIHIVIERRVPFSELGDEEILYYFFNQLLRSYGCSLTDNVIHKRIKYLQEHV